MNKMYLYYNDGIRLLEENINEQEVIDIIKELIHMIRILIASKSYDMYPSHLTYNVDTLHSIIKLNKLNINIDDLRSASQEYFRSWYLERMHG